MTCATLSKVRLFGLLSMALAAAVARPTTSAVAQQPAGAANEAATRQYATAVALQNREQFELAAEQWKNFLATSANDPRAARARHYYGLCLLKTRQFPAALEVFDKLLAEAPRLAPDALVAEAADGSKLDLLPSTYLYKGLAEYNLGQAGDGAMFARAGKTLATLAEKYPNTRYAAQALYYQGEAAYAQGRKAEAAPFYEQLLKQFPDDPLVADARYALGVTQAELGQNAAAEATFASFLKQFPTHRFAPEVTMRRGEMLLALGKPEQAEKLFAEAAAAPGFELADHAVMRQAACLFELGKYAEARKLYASVPERFAQSPYRAAAWLGAGRCAYLEGKYDDARTLLVKLTSADGDAFFEAGHWRVRGALKQGYAQPALELVDQLLQQAGTTAWAVQLQLDRADTLFDLADRQRDALAAFATIADEHPRDELAPQARYMAAYTALTVGDYKAAESQAEKFVKAFPESELLPSVLYVAAESDLLRGNYRDADKTYERLLKKFADSPDAAMWQLRRGIALVMDKKHKEAVAALEPIAGKLSSPDLNAEA
ncbi:MAG TPA: tetratricopeptide repeat protein, partial [Pirellulales bacterium]|nr:tetratricopeptide repeat protein [Pirellulales bacterium]